jgi:hypothetical protein
LVDRKIFVNAGFYPYFHKLNGIYKYCPIPCILDSLAPSLADGKCHLSPAGIVFVTITLKLMDHTPKKAACIRVILRGFCMNFVFFDEISIPPLLAD